MAKKDAVVVDVGVEGNPGKTQITINEGDRQKGAKKGTCGKKRRDK